jgi:hypothetical protein
MKILLTLTVSKDLILCATLERVVFLEAIFAKHEIEK